MGDEILLKRNEDGTYSKYEPYVTIDIETEEDFNRLQELLEFSNRMRWIPCSERLPENNKPCLCWVESTTIASGETFIIGSCSNGFWFLQTYEIGTHSFPVKDYKVVAWMPLPKPYKAGSAK